MRHITSVIAKALFTTLIGGGMLAATAQAQFMNGAEATIPFEFSTRNQNMAAGNYEIELLPDQFLLAIHKAGTGRNLIFTVRQEESRTAPTHGYLTFHRNGDHLYLSEIHFAGTQTYSVVLQKRQLSTNDVKVAFSAPAEAVRR